MQKKQQLMKGMQVIPKTQIQKTKFKCVFCGATKRPQHPRSDRKKPWAEQYRAKPIVKDKTKQQYMCYLCYRQKNTARKLMEERARVDARLKKINISIRR